MRIAHVTPVYPPRRGGTGQVAHEYSTRLRARGHDVRVFTPEGVGSSDSRFVQRVRASIRVGNAAVVPSLPRALGDFDLVHLHYPFFGGAEPVLWARSRGRKPALVLTYHMDPLADRLKGRLFGWHSRLLLPWLLKRADRVLVSSQEYLDSSLLATMDGLHDVEVHPFGVDAARFTPGRDSHCRSALRIAASDVVILFVGSLDGAHTFKGLHVLFGALSGMLSLQWRLVIVGDGAHRLRLARHVEDARLASRVIFVGAPTDEQLPYYYRAADLHVLPSTTRSEAFGLVTLEAAATGLPSVVSDLPGVRTNVINGGTGILVPAGDAVALAAALRDLIASPEKRRRLGEAARVRAVRDFAWEPLIDKLEDTYYGVIGTH